jgi:glycosyltransferase involved in cell wall biosynthesis
MQYARKDQIYGIYSGIKEYILMNKIELSIIIPCYNEAGNILLIVKRLRDILANRRDIEVLLVNNGSTDNSQEIFNSELAKKENSFARVVYVEVNKGYGFGIMAGVREANGQIIAWTHADMQTDPSDVLEIFNKYQSQILSGKYYAKGRRVDRNPADSFFTWGMSIISSVFLGAKLNDINAQPKMFDRSFLKYLQNPPDDFSLDLYLMYQAHKHKIELIEMPVSFAKRQHGIAKGGGTFGGKVKLIKRTFKYINQISNEVKSGNR